MCHGRSVILCNSSSRATSCSFNAIPRSILLAKKRMGRRLFLIAWSGYTNHCAYIDVQVSFPVHCVPLWSLVYLQSQLRRWLPSKLEEYPLLHCHRSTVPTTVYTCSGQTCQKLWNRFCFCWRFPPWIPPLQLSLPLRTVMFIESLYLLWLQSVYHSWFSRVIQSNDNDLCLLRPW